MTSVRTTKAAERDIAAIASYLAERDAGAAAKLVSELRDKVASLAARPDRQRMRPEYGEKRRRLNCRGYAIIYVYDPARDLVRISRVLHGARDLQVLFRP